MKIIAGIVTYNSRRTIERCLESLIAAIRGINTEIIVYDNCSQDDTVKFLSENFSDIKLMTGKENRGYAYGVNRIAEMLQFDYLLIVNPDLYIRDDAVKTAFEFAQSKSDTGIIGARIVDSNGASIHSHGDLPTPDSFVLDFSGLRRFFTSGESGSFKSVENQAEPFKAGFVTGAFMFIPHDAWELAGSMDENFFLYFEDVDLAFRLKELGRASYVHPGIIAEHESGASFPNSGDFAKYKLKCWFESAYLFFGKHYGWDIRITTFKRMVKIVSSKSAILKLAGKSGSDAMKRQRLILEIHDEIKSEIMV